MKHSIKKTIAFLLTLLMVVNVCPLAATSDSGEVAEYGPLNLGSRPRPIYLDYELQPGQDAVTLQEITEAAGEPYTNDMILWAQNPDKLVLSSDYRTISNLSSLEDGETGTVWVYDYEGGENKWAIYVTFYPSGRPHRVTILLEEGQDSITLQEIVEAAGEEYTDQLGMYDPKPDTIQFSTDWLTLTNLSSIPANETGSVSVYDWATNEYAIYVTFVAPEAADVKTYVVKQTGTVSQAAILDAAGVTESQYDSYYLLKDDMSQDYSAYLTTNVVDHTVSFLTTELPEEGLLYKLTANGQEPAPFKLLFVGSDNPLNANDGIFTYKLNESNGTATVTGFVDGLDEEIKANITIPATMTWPADSETEYSVTGIAASAFKQDAAIQTVTINSPVFSIGDYAFQECPNLTEVKQTAGGTGSRLTIGQWIFSEEGSTTSKLKVFTSEAGIDNIDYKAFAFTQELETFRAGSGQKTQIGQNAFQNCSGEFFFDGGIGNLGDGSFYNTSATTITTTSIDYAYSNSVSGWPMAPQTDLVLNVAAITDGKLTDSVLTDKLLKYVAGFRNITVNLEQGVSEISAGAFSSFDFDSHETLTVNVNTEDNDATATAAEESIPADQPKLQVNFRMNRENVTGADTAPLPMLEKVGRVTYLDSTPLDTHYHDDVFWYERENGVSRQGGK